MKVPAPFRLLLALGAVLLHMNGQTSMKDAPFFCEPVVPGSVVFRGYAIGEYETGEKQPVRFHVEEIFFGNLADKDEAIALLDLKEAINSGDEHIVVSTPGESESFWRSEPFDPDTNKAYLAYLRGLRLGKAPARLLGWISAMDESLLTDVVVEARGAQRRYEARSKNGIFEIAGVLPGKYQIAAKLDGYYNVTNFEDVEVVPAGCATASFLFEFEGDIRGTVKNEHGEPQQLRVDLVRVDDDEDSPYESRQSDLDGNYWFGNVDPGQYRVGVNLIPDAGSRQPYPKAYAPGVEDENRATVVTISHELPSAQADLWVNGPALRTFEISVVWPDGHPAKDATLSSIYCRWPEKSDFRTDVEGKITLQAYSELGYRLYAIARSPDSGEIMDSLQSVIHSGADKVSVRLVLAVKHEEFSLP